MIRHLVAVLLLAAAPAVAQTAPQVSVALDPEGPVTVGTHIEVTATVLVPTYMPAPPVWPDLEVADAITRLPERATRPATQRVGGESWSGVARTWEITPQRAADFDLGRASITVTWADPDSNAPVTAILPLPPVTVSATVPPGAEGIDPFLAATSVAVTAKVDGLPATPKPGDAFTLTLAITASGPPAMLLPPLAGRLPTLPGLRAYPREPVLADGDTATRTETVTYVVEAPGSYTLPAVRLDWWDTGASARRTAATRPVTIEVPAPPGWRGEGSGMPRSRLTAAVALLCLAVAASALLWRRRVHRPRPPTERSRYRALRRAIRSEPAAAVRQAFTDWGAAGPDVESALRRLERSVYGAAPSARSEAEARSQLLAASERARSASRAARKSHPGAVLPSLNPPARALAE